jgi:hypothetical protein
LKQVPHGEGGVLTSTVLAAVAGAPASSCS